MNVLLKRSAIVAIIFIITASFALPFVSYGTASISATANVTVNGRRLTFTDQHPVILQDRVLVPLRDVFEYLGFEVVWNPRTQIVTMTNRRFEIIVTIGSYSFIVNGEQRSLDAPAQIINDRTMLPIRAILESADFIVSWNNSSRTVEILKPLVGNWDEIVVSGDDLFTVNIAAALTLIRSGPPEIHALVIRYIGAITQGSHSGMWFRLVPPTFVVAHRTYTSSTTWLAGVIVHDAVHSMQYHRHLARYGSHVPRYVYFGMDAEMEALEIQIDFLIAVNAPQNEIDHAKSLRGTIWWDELPTW